MPVLSVFEMSSEALPADFLQQPTQIALFFERGTNLLPNLLWRAGGVALQCLFQGAIR